MDEQEVKMLDAEDCAKYIESITGVDYETVLKVMDAETEYMIQVGIINVE